MSNENQNSKGGKPVFKGLTVEVLADMLRIQNEQQVAYLGENWEKKKLPYVNAILTELVEMLGWTGWEWWKPSTYNYSQMVLEASDVLQFMLSDILTEGRYGEGESKFEVLAARQIENCWGHPDVLLTYSNCCLNSSDILEVLECETNEYINTFSLVLAYSQITWEQVIKIFYAKVTLNAVRRENGYKNGTYQKIWSIDSDGNKLEDNDVMLAALEREQWDTSDWQEFQKKLHAWLTSTYHLVAGI